MLNVAKWSYLSLVSCHLNITFFLCQVPTVTPPLLPSLVLKSGCGLSSFRMPDKDFLEAITCDVPAGVTPLQVQVKDSIQFLVFVAFFEGIYISTMNFSIEQKLQNYCRKFCSLWFEWSVCIMWSFYFFLIEISLCTSLCLIIVNNLSKGIDKLKRVDHKQKIITVQSWSYISQNCIYNSEKVNFNSFHHKLQRSF